MKIFKPLPAPGFYSSFSRASTALLQDFDGNFYPVGTGLERVSHGEEVTNLAVMSEDFANAAWSKNLITVTTGLSVGGLTGVTMLQNTLTSASFISQAIRLATGTMALSTWRMRQGTATQNWFMRRTSTEASAWYLNWTDGVPTASGVPGDTTVIIQPVGNGWYDVTTIRALGEDNQGCRLYPDTSNTGGTVYVKHAQFELGSVPHAYLLNTTTAPTTKALGAPVLLLEPAATNRALQSQALNTAPWSGPASVTAAAESYRGYAPFWTLAKTLSTGSESRSQGIGAVAAGESLSLTLALLAGSVSTLSLGLFGSVTVWGTVVGYTAEVIEGPGSISASIGTLTLVQGLSIFMPTLVRVTRLHASAENATIQIYPGSHTSTTIGDSVKVTRVQVEAGEKATSYIPTTTATATRAAETLSASASDSGTGGPAGDLFTTAVDYWGEWIATSYGIVGTRVVRKGSLYELAPAASATSLDVPGEAPTVWLRVGPANRMAQFDGEVSSRTYSHPLQGLRNSRFSTTVSIGNANAVLLSDIDSATAVRVQVVDAVTSEIVLDQTFTPEDGGTYVRSQLLVSGFLVPSGSGRLNFGFSAPFGTNPGVGLVAFGVLEPLGCVQYNPRAGIRDFSRKEADEFGQVVFVRRRNSKTLSCVVEVDKADINRVQDRLYTLTATPVVWVASDDTAHQVPLVVFGFFKDFFQAIAYPMKSLMTLEIEGLT